MNLSPAESKVIQFIQKGYSNQDIALQLGVCEKTVKFHLNNIFKIYNVKSRAELCAQLNGFTKQNEELVVSELTKDSKSNLPIKTSPQMTQTEKIQFVNDTFKVGNAIEQLHHMMKNVIKEDINPATVNAACNCVARLNETINTAIQASRFLNER